LFLATGGSFHSWKFLPILGEYVVALLQGKLDAALQKRWAWDRDQEGGSHQHLTPKRDWKDLVDY
jgi:sarcosine oxidase / L-pipecolate oxidase